MGIFWETSLVDFLLVTVFLGGGGSYLTGRSVALTWRPLAQLVVYVVGLTAAVRFIHYALFGGTLLTAQYFLVDLVILLAFGWLGYRITKTSLMVSQYSWLFERITPLTWRERAKPG